ncbi:uncharacterized protein LOC129227565 [Uloborus diversus]|uniref:uncharacterized protein LOC129227565 n=1 Tax=Uloborus diversus TaxID=327109 RepID=UPI002408FFE3|nr:uncharacterized protein LOC129227565 [Uloborus diversus]XP_054718122.1 uncharacterized protein LOC129227565 [Uloborus diversus]
MDRSIPHIKNIFSNTSSRKKSTSDTQDLCQSPREKRKNNKDASVERNSFSPKKSGKESSGKENCPKDESRSKGCNRNYATYTSKTLSERDMRHLERHLSMKKTIRKQISRNLAQAFLENPDIFEPEGDKPDSHKSDHILPENRMDFKKCSSKEQNVLDLLKVSIEDRDSGHSSPTHEQSEDTDYEDESDTWRSSSKHRNSDTRGLVEDVLKPEGEKKSSSIWGKMFSRGKGKRQ